MKAINDYKIATLKVMMIGETKEIKPIISADDVYKVMKFIAKEDREYFYVLHLNANNRIIGKELVSVGTLTNNLVHPREVFKAAILNNSVSIICVHNHPSGDATPSPEDIAITDKLVQAGRLLGIPVLDHVIITSEGFEHIAIKDERSIYRANVIGERNSYLPAWEDLTCFLRCPVMNLSG